MKRFFRMIVSAVLVLAMCAGTFLAVGCGQGGGSGDKEILFWAESVGVNATKFDEYVTYFNENNPYGYTMKIDLKESLTGSLREARTAGIGPDVVSFPRWETATSYALVKDLTDLIAKSDIDLADYNSEALKEITVNDKVYGVPTDVDAWGIWVNQDLVDAYNANNPSTKIELPLETWAEWKEVAQKLTKKNGAQFETMGFNSEGFRGQMFTLMQTAGVNYVNTDVSPCMINLPEEESMAVLNFIYDMVFNAGVYAPHTDSIANFYQGKVAMQFGSTGFKQEVDTYAGKTDAMNMTFMGTPARSATQGKISGVLGGFSFAIPNIKSVNTDKSWKAIQWMLSDEVMTKFCEVNGVMPAKASLQTDELLSKNPTFMTLRGLLPTYVTRPSVRGYSTMEVSVMFGELDKLIAGNQDVATTRNNMIKNGNQVFELAVGM